MTLDRIGVELRRISACDVDRLMHLYNNRSPQSVKYFKPLGENAARHRFDELIAANVGREATHVDLVAQVNGSIVGWAFAWDIHLDKPKFGIVVDDNFHGQGIGQRLIDAVIKASTGAGVKQIYLRVVTENRRAIRLYEKCGFKKLRNFVSNEDGQAYFEMVCQLNA